MRSAILSLSTAIQSHSHAHQCPCAHRVVHELSDSIASHCSSFAQQTIGGDLNAMILMPFRPKRTQLLAKIGKSLPVAAMPKTPSPPARPKSWGGMEDWSDEKTAPPSRDELAAPENKPVEVPDATEYVFDEAEQATFIAKVLLTIARAQI